MSKVSQSAEAAQLALTQLIASGKKVNQYAVEKKAGSNDWYVFDLMVLFF